MLDSWKTLYAVYNQKRVQELFKVRSTSHDPRILMEDMENYLDLKVCLGCLVKCVEKRNRLDTFRQERLTIILQDEILRQNIEALLIAALELREPEHLFQCLFEYRKATFLLRNRLDWLLEDKPADGPPLD